MFDHLDVYCANCHNSFRSTIFTNVSKQVAGTVCRGVSEKCGDCGVYAFLDDGIFIDTLYGVRFLPDGRTATVNSHAQVLKVVSEQYVVVRSAGKICSLSWKIWSKNEEIYFVCREMPDWKLSIHRSGVDHFGLVNQEHVVASGGRANAVRHFSQGTRSLPFAAHGNRLFAACINSNFKRPFAFAKRMKRNQFNKASFLTTTNTKNIYLELLYFEGHPELYVENLGIVDNCIALLKGADNEYIALLARSESDIVHHQSIFKKNYDFSRYGDKHIDVVFGKSTVGAFMITIDHP